jgi:hypothetical protein
MALAPTLELIHFAGFRPVRDDMNLARHFSAGTSENKLLSPVGTTEWRRKFSRDTTLHIMKDIFVDEFNRPYGTPPMHFQVPALKCRAKLILSLTGRKSGIKNQL